MTTTETKIFAQLASDIMVRVVWLSNKLLEGTDSVLARAAYVDRCGGVNVLNPRERHANIFIIKPHFGIPPRGRGPQVFLRAPYWKHRQGKLLPTVALAFPTPKISSAPTPHYLLSLVKPGAHAAVNIFFRRLE